MKMAILQIFKDLIKKEKSMGVKVKARHIAITTDGAALWAKNNKKGLEEAYKKSNLIIKSTIKTQIKLNIPILTLYILPSDLKNPEQFSMIVDSMVELFNDLITSDSIHKNKVKVSVLGKWYDLPGRIVDTIKSLVDETSDYDNFFVNFCINYNGQEEIVDACKLIVRKVISEKIDVDSITKNTIKDNTYSSYFLPPDLIIKSGLTHTNSGLLLWDSVNSRIYFTDKLWPDFGKDDFKKAVEAFEKQNI